MIPNGPASPAVGTELELHWRSSRHARRLLTLGLAGLFIAVLARRPEFAGLAAPALLLLVAGRAQRRPPHITVSARPSSRRVFEGERLAVDVVADGAGECAVRWRLHPGLEIAPVGAATADGQRARFVVTSERWGRRQLGTLEVTLRDRWRLAEGHVSMPLPSIDCYPAPAQQLDQRFVEALRDMRERGFNMLVVDVLNTEPPARRRTEDRIARRIWRMEQEAIRFSLRELGVPVVHWDGEESLDLPLAAHTRRPMAAWR
jgi:uncharacterized protein (DUF58 family)